jgi:hypothetical protein
MTLHASRSTGRMTVADEAGNILAVVPFLALSDNARAAQEGNPTRDPLKPYGDTPTGVWAVQQGTPQLNVRTYGPYAPLILSPLSGQAVLAYADGKRSGIWVHSGDLSTTGHLRPTYGCIRVHNSSLGLFRELSQAHGPIARLELE